MAATESLEEIEKVAARRLKDEIQTAPKPKIVIPLKGKPVPGKTRITGLKDPTAAANFVADKVEEFVRECEKRVQKQLKIDFPEYSFKFTLKGELGKKARMEVSADATRVAIKMPSDVKIQTSLSPIQILSAMSLTKRNTPFLKI